MSYTMTQNLIDEKLEQYGEEEFQSLIDIIDRKELIDAIKKNSKRFAQDTKGWRIDKLDKNKLKEIYFKHVYKKREPNLSKKLVTLINQISMELVEILEVKLGNIDDVALEVKNNNKQYIDKIISLLLDTSYCENIILCFKLLEIELSEASVFYIDEAIKQELLIKDEKKKIINNISKEFNEKLKEREKKLSEIIKNKEKEIRDLNSSIDSIKKKFALEIEEKEIEVLKLKEYNLAKERKFNLELEKLNRKIDDLEQKLEKSIIKLEEAKRISDRKEEEINRLSYLLEDKYDRFDEYAKSRWETENNELQSKNKSLDMEIKNLEVYKQCIEEEIFMLKKDKENIEITINSLEHRSKEFISNIDYIINRIRKTHTNKEDTYEIKDNLSSRINHIKSILIEENPEVKEDIFDFIDDLSDNFECMGIGNNYTYNLAKYTYASIANKMGLFVVGYNNRLFADAISYTICNSSADIVVIPPGFTDSKELINIVNNITSKVVLIENAIDNIAESVYMPLIKENKNKILIFSMESSENINIISKSVFNYLMVVDLDSILESEQNEELYACIVHEDIFKTDKDNTGRKTKLLKGFRDILDLSNISIIKMMEVINIINSLDSEDKSTEGIYSLLLFSIGMILKNQNNDEKIIRFIKEQNFESEKLKKINTVIEMDIQNE